ncbi:MAG: outer membrane beta-barrel protein [Gemmatimonas sp.]|nr:outer membrane beta-barrel protein [Gemmatimonas sp.]
MYKRIAMATLTSLVMVGLAGPNTANAQLGITAGPSFAQLSDIDVGDTQATFDNATGWHAHLWLDLPMGPIAIRPGVRYMDAGALFEDAMVNEVRYGRREKTSLIEVPVDVRFRLPVPAVTPYVMAGPVLRFPVGRHHKDKYNRLSLAGGAGVGLEVGLGPAKLYPELKYTFGITRFTKETYEIGDTMIRPDKSQRMNAVMLSLGIGL